MLYTNISMFTVSIMKKKSIFSFNLSEMDAKESKTFLLMQIRYKKLIVCLHLLKDK